MARLRIADLPLVVTLPEARRTIMRPKKHVPFWITSAILVAMVALGWIGIRVKPSPFPSTQHFNGPETFIPLRTGLPTPVERFYRQHYGERIPVIHSAIISGRGTMRIPQLFNLKLPVRFRFLHEAGLSYRHYIEVTFFGQPILKVNEYFVDGKERQELPWAVATGNPKLDQGGNLGMWAEIIEWMPSVLLTDPRVRWEAMDDDTAILVVPFGAQEERFVVRFNPASGEVQYWEVMRYANGEGEKTLWINGTWFEDGKPWFVITEEKTLYNVEVDTSLTAKGP